MIDQALAENRFSQWLLYGLTTVFVTTGLAIAAWTAYRGDPTPIPIVMGVFTAGSFMTAIQVAHRMRRESITIRLFELPLSKATTNEEALEILMKLMDSLKRDRKRRDLSSRILRLSFGNPSERR